MQSCILSARPAVRPLALAAVFSSFSSFAKSASGPELKEMFVTATLSGQPIGDVVADVTLIDREVIERSGAAALADVLVSALRYDNTTATSPVLPGYTLVNLSASTALSKDWKALVRVDNLTDKTYQTVNTYATAKRSLYVGLTWAPQ